MGEVRNHARTLTVEESLSWIRETIKERNTPSKNLQLPPTKRWSNHEYDYVKSAVETDYDNALANGYEDFQSNGSSLHVLRPKKAP
jgi:hypothetical protein